MALVLVLTAAEVPMLVGRSQVMTTLRQTLDRVARTDFTVLIDGESGAGKELAARHVHFCSPRSRGPFVAINCAAIVETLVETELFGIEDRTATGVRGRRGKFELANHGTLFLDEIGDLSLTAQAKLLRVLQDLRIERVGSDTVQSVDTRIVAATNRSLAQLVAEQKFRADLYYRLSGVEIHVPPLRSRIDDVPILAAHVLGRHGRPGEWRLTSRAIEALMAYHWPGNVRQLERVMERAVALSGDPDIDVDDLPAEISTPYAILASGDERPEDQTLKAWSRRYARLVLDRCQGNKRRACEMLDISYHTLQTYLAEMGDRAETNEQAARDEVPGPVG